MTTQVTDTFTGTDGAALDSRAGETGATWTKGSGYSGSAVIASNRVRSNSSSGAVYYSSGVATVDGEYVEAILEHFTAAGAVGVGVRGNSTTQKHYCLIIDGATPKLYRFNSNASVDLLATGSAISAGAHTVRVTCTGTGATVDVAVLIDGAAPFATYSDTSGNRITGLGKATVYSATAATTSSTGCHIASITLEDPAVADSITITTPASRRVFQRDDGASVGSISVAGAYTGTPTTIEARLVEYGTSTAVSGFDWAVKVASPSGSAYSFSFTNAPCGGWYSVQVRWSNDTGVTATSGRTGVGMLLSVTGQSFAYGWFRVFSSPTRLGGDSTLTPNDLSAVSGIINTNSTWTLPDTAAMNAVIQFANDMISATGWPVGVIDSAWDGSGLTVTANGGKWDSATAGQPYDLWKTTTTALGGKYEAVLWAQGNADAASGVSQATYATAQDTLFANFRSYTSQASLPVIVMYLPRNTASSYTDANAEKIRAAHRAVCDDSVTFGMSLADATLSSDGVHPIASGMTLFGRRVAQAVKFAAGLATYGRGPSIARVEQISTTVYDVVLRKRGGTDFTPTTAITGFRVLDGTTPVTPSSVVRQSSSRIRITLPSGPAGALTVQYQYGAAITITGAVKDNSLELLPLEPSDAVAVSAALTLASVVRDGSAAALASTTVRWAWFDAATINTVTDPSDQGSLTTNGSGAFSITLDNSGLASGDTGFLVLSTSAGVAATESRGAALPYQIGTDPAAINLLNQLGSNGSGTAGTGFSRLQGGH